MSEVDISEADKPEADKPEAEQAQTVSPAQNQSTAVHVIAPLAAMAATWVARKVMDSAYRGVTGHRPPSAHDPRTSLKKALAWAAITAAAAAVVEVAVYRFASQETDE